MEGIVLVGDTPQALFLSKQWDLLQTDIKRWVRQTTHSARLAEALASAKGPHLTIWICPPFIARLMEPKVNHCHHFNHTETLQTTKDVLAALLRLETVASSSSSSSVFSSPSTMKRFPFQHVDICLLGPADPRFHDLIFNPLVKDHLGQGRSKPYTFFTHFVSLPERPDPNGRMLCLGTGTFTHAEAFLIPLLHALNPVSPPLIKLADPYVVEEATATAHGMTSIATVFAQTSSCKASVDLAKQLFCAQPLLSKRSEYGFASPVVECHLAASIAVKQGKADKLFNEMQHLKQVQLSQYAHELSQMSKEQAHPPQLELSKVTDGISFNDEKHMTHFLALPKVRLALLLDAEHGIQVILKDTPQQIEKAQEWLGASFKYTPLIRERKSFAQVLGSSKPNTLLRRPPLPSSSSSSSQHNSSAIVPERSTYSYQRSQSHVQETQQQRRRRRRNKRH